MKKYKKIFDEVMEKIYSDFGPEIEEPEVEPTVQPDVEPDIETDPDRFNPFRPEFPDDDPNTLPQPKAEDDLFKRYNNRN